MRIIQDPSPNYSCCIIQHKYIVIHTAEGTTSGTLAWLKNPASEVSAHYLVATDGLIYQLVAEYDMAWHAGRIVGTPTTPLYDGTNPNLVSIGIEFAGYFNRPLSAAQVMAGVDLIRDIRQRYGPLPLVTHSELSPEDRFDPGADNMNVIRGALGEGMDENTIREWAKEETRAVLSGETWLQDAVDRAVQKAVAEVVKRLSNG